MRRSREDIIRDILKVCKEPVNKTRIVYQANLNFKNARDYLNWMQGRGLIILDGPYYRILPKGEKLLNNLRRTERFIVGTEKHKNE